MARLFDFSVEDATVFSATASSVLNDNRQKYGPQLAYKGGSTTNPFGFFLSNSGEDFPWFQLHVRPQPLTSVTIIIIKVRYLFCGKNLLNLEILKS